MHDFDETDFIVIAFFAGLGLAWSLMTGFVAITRLILAPKLDLAGILSIVPFWPVYMSGLLGPILYRQGLYDDPVVITMAIGALGGLLAGLTLLVLRRWYSIW